eukprot:CAMPEP_0197685772 /NCGR_PEP_ID=MMETSP1338-20131121/101460_1 /TAXON_ID=43686 ORGANISM="Pelagodinium beii, Strain RCC1491" /NCGR_SAMPLE_ID=MMETSP1338 /ASSEMBLY_ACC=CAM_ASM_000754 /LENGTH=30 /DNA_ID= /DNA_START= /DNA_END= /DNA_ORIENTATION=
MELFGGGGVLTCGGGLALGVDVGAAASGGF